MPYCSKELSSSLYLFLLRMGPILPSLLLGVVFFTQLSRTNYGNAIAFGSTLIY